MTTDISEHGLESLICTALAGDPNVATHSGNEKARARYEHNRFSVTRQLQYSRDNTRPALDLYLLISSLPVAAFELRNSLTKQTVEDAIKQYNRDRSNGEKLFEFGPVPTCGGTGKLEPEIDHLSNILRMFNELFGNIDWKDADKIGKVIAEELPAKVAADKAYRNAMENSDRQNARIEHDKALERAVTELLSDHAELFKQFSDNESFRKWLSETNFRTTYRQPANV